MQTRKKSNHVSVHQRYLDCCDALGIPGVWEAVEQMIRYIVEGAISKKELKALGLLKENGEMLAGVYRGDAQSVGGFIYWYPWIDPHVDEPDFHIPATLGRFVFLPE